MNLGSPVNTPVGYGAPPSYSGFQSPVPGVQPQFHSTMVGGQNMTPLGQSPVVAGSQMQQGNPGTPGFLPGYLMGSFPQQVLIEYSQMICSSYGFTNLELDKSTKLLQNS